MMRHFFTQGIGLRQVVDYYYLLKQGVTDEEAEELIQVLKKCGLYKFFTSILWIETHYLKLDIEVSHIRPNKKAGELVLHEMIKGGNFGKQYKHRNSNPFLNYLMQFTYNLRYIIQFPVETISRPIAIVCGFVSRHCFKNINIIF